MTLTVRSATVTGATTKGSPLTHAELDENFNHLSQAANISVTQSGSGAVARTAQAKMRDVVSVKDFGATGDGTTDDAAAIQAAHDAFTNTGALYFPAGNYLVGTALTCSKKIRMYGDGTSEGAGSIAGATKIIKKSTLTTAVLTITGNNSSIDGIEFEGENGNTGDGIQVSANRVQLKDVAVYSMGQDGIRIGTDAGVNANLWYLQNVKAKSNGRHGVYLSDNTSPTASDCNGGTFVHGDLQSNTSDGLRLGNSAFNTFVGITVQTNGGDGVHLTGDAKDNIFLGGDWNENNTDNDLEIESGALRNVFFWPILTSAGTSDSGTNSVLFTQQASISQALKWTGLTSTATELNILDGVNATTEEINGLDISQRVRLFDDFLGDVIADQWNGRVGSDGQCVAPAILAGQNRGVLRMVAGDDAAADMATNGVQLESALNWRATQGSLAFEARVAISNIASVCVYLGFTDQASALEMPFTISGTTLTSNTSNGCGVLFDTEATTDNWKLVGVATDVDATVQDAGVAPVNGTMETWRIELTSAGVATFFRNGVAIGSAMSGAVTAATQLTPVLAMFSRTSATRNLDCDYIFVQSAR